MLLMVDERPGAVGYTERVKSPLSQSPAQPTVEEFLAGAPPQVRETVEWLRALVRATVPNCIERVYPGWQLIGYRVPHGKKSHYFGFIAPQGERVALGFEYGVRMSDPHGVLRGTGRQVRQVEFTAPGELDLAVLTALIEEAVFVAIHRTG